MNNNNNNNNKNAVLVMSSKTAFYGETPKSQLRAEEKRNPKPQPKAMYAIVFGRPVRITKSEVEMFKDFKIIYK